MGSPLGQLTSHRSWNSVNWGLKKGLKTLAHEESPVLFQPPNEQKAGIWKKNIIQISLVINVAFNTHGNVFKRRDTIKEDCTLASVMAACE